MPDSASIPLNWKKTETLIPLFIFHQFLCRSDGPHESEKSQNDESARALTGDNPEMFTHSDAEDRQRVATTDANSTP